MLHTVVGKEVVGAGAEPCGEMEARVVLWRRIDV